MTAISREMQYLEAHRQVDDTRRLRALWLHATQRERLTRQLPWLMRALAGATGLLVFGAAAWWWHPAAGAGLVVGLLAAWLYLEWRWQPARRGRSLAWEQDRLNPQFEGAFSLLDWLDAAEGPARGPRQAVLEVTLARVDWNRGMVTPDRQAERRRALSQSLGLGLALVLGALLVWLWAPRPAATGNEPPGGSALMPVSPPPVRIGAGPRIVGLKIRVEPPGYTRLPAQETFQPTIQAPVGSRVLVTWQVDTDRRSELQHWVRMGDRRLTAPASTPEGVWEIPANVPAGEAAIEAQTGAQTARQPLYLTWREDRAPAVQAVVPDKIERDRDGIRFQLHVEDDYGLTRIEVLVSTQSPASAPTTRVETLTVDLGPGQDAFHGPVLIPAQTLDLLRQDRLRLQVKAWDTRTDATGKPAPNIGATEPADFLVVQPWDNAHKPRSLNRKAGDDGDQKQTGDQPTGGGGAPQTPTDNLAPKMLQKHPDEPAGPQQAQPEQGNGQGNQSKYNQMAGSQGDPEKNQPNGQPQQGPQDAPDAPDHPPPSAPPPTQPPDPNGQTGAGQNSSAPSTDGAKQRENLPPAVPPAGNPNAQPPADRPPPQDGEHGGNAGAPEQPTGSDNQPAAPPTPPPSTDNRPPPTPPNQSNSGGGLPPNGGGSHNERRSRSAGTQDTDPNAKGNAAVDENVAVRADTSVEAALQYAREKPLGAWQRNFGGRSVRDRVVQSTEAVAGGNLVGDPAGSAPNAVQGAGTVAVGSEQNLAAERARLDQRYSERIEQYLQRVRREPAPATNSR